VAAHYHPGGRIVGVIFAMLVWKCHCHRHHWQGGCRPSGSDGSSDCQLERQMLVWGVMGWWGDQDQRTGQIVVVVVGYHRDGGRCWHRS